MGGFLVEFNDMDKKYPKIGLALGSGGVRGYAHIGVIKKLEENNIPIDFIVGSSVGAVIGSHYSLFKDIRGLEGLVLSSGWREIFSLVDPSLRGGLIKGEKIREFFDKNLKGAEFSELKIPFKVIATDLKSGDAVELSNGKISEAVRASVSVPVIFKPVLIQGKELIDGGISNPVPVDTLKNMGADIVIAVNLVNKKSFDEKLLAKEKSSTPQKLISFLYYNLAKKCAESADFIIEPEVKSSGIIGVKHILKGEGKKMILEGEKSTESILPQIKKLICSKD